MKFTLTTAAGTPVQTLIATLNCLTAEQTKELEQQLLEDGEAVIDQKFLPPIRLQLQPDADMSPREIPNVADARPAQVV